MRITYIQGPLVLQGLVRTAQDHLVCSAGHDGSPAEEHWRQYLINLFCDIMHFDGSWRCYEATYPRPSAIVALASRATRATSGISSSTCVTKSQIRTFWWLGVTSWATGTASTTWSYSTWSASLVTLESIMGDIRWSEKIMIMIRILLMIETWSRCCGGPLLFWPPPPYCSLLTPGAAPC